MPDAPIPPTGPSEFDLIRWLRGQVKECAAVPVGIGDDAAVVALAPGEHVVVTTDMVIDGVHFKGAEVGPFQVGHKAVARCLSDVAAMAAEPLAVVVAMAAPRNLTMAYFQDLFRGLKAAADACNARIVGGDISCAELPLTLTVTGLGSIPDGAALRRDGARVGDMLMVTGDLGGSILGRHLTFLPRLKEALWLRRSAALHGMIDISDGLAPDAGHLAEESRVGIELWEEAIPISRAARDLAERSGRTPLEHALYDGEDYELLFTAASRDATALLQRSDLPVKLSCIGEVVAGHGVSIRRKGEETRPLPPGGWVHTF